MWWLIHLRYLLKACQLDHLVWPARPHTFLQAATGSRFAVLCTYVYTILEPCIMASSKVVTYLQQMWTYPLSTVNAAIYCLHTRLTTGFNWTSPSQCVKQCYTRQHTIVADRSHHAETCERGSLLDSSLPKPSLSPILSLVAAPYAKAWHLHGSTCTHTWFWKESVWLETKMYIYATVTLHKKRDAR